jgi:AraC family transcriptional regulator
MADGSAGGFGVQETHGILWRPESQVRITSDRLGWTSLYASLQREAPYEAKFAAVRDHLIVLHLDGPVGVARTLGETQSHRMVAPGGLFILPGGMDFGVRLESSLDSLHIYLRQEILDQVATELGLDAAGPVELLARIGVQDSLIEQLALNIRDLLESQEPYSRLYANYVARLLAAQLLRKHSTATLVESALQDPQTVTAVKRAIDYMEAKLGEALSVPRVAKAAGMSPSHFARCFKGATGFSPHRYLLSLRVERAKRLLLQRRESIAEIALACGFAHQEHLTNVFRRFSGLTPAGYRREAHS